MTDSGTHGLRGPVLPQEQLQQRGYELDDEENWAAFEGQGFTKSDGAALGSRGQGKSAFLYHSNPPGAVRGRRMMMLYDTLLEKGEYRLGVRNANPADEIKSPPYSGNEARSIIRDRYTDNTDLEIDLSLDPLQEIGTRVIIPYLSNDAVDAIRNGELAAWLQRCWWRAIQTKDLEIVIDDGKSHRQEIRPPSWWRNEPWENTSSNGATVRKRESIDLGNGLRIKRIVLMYDENLGLGDATGGDAQFGGVQLLRGRQWITTISRELSEFVPKERRPGFRGFVEFDQTLEKELRVLEDPQHTGFDRYNKTVQAIYRAVEDTVEGFAQELGWRRQKQAPEPERQPEIIQKFLRWIAPNARGPKSSPTPDKWECKIGYTLPDSQKARVNWGEHLGDVRVSVVSPAAFPMDVSISLEGIHVDGGEAVSLIRETPLDFFERDGEARFGSLKVVRDTAGDGQIALPRQGRWELTARVHQGGWIVKSASRSIYIHEDPPPRELKPLTVSISVENRTRPDRRGSDRIDYGDRVAVQINARNNTPDDILTDVTASIPDVEKMISNSISSRLKGTPGGDTADRQAAWVGDVVFFRPDEIPPDVPGAITIPVEAGRKRLNVDLIADGDVCAWAPYTLHIAIDPANRDWEPFQLQGLPDEDLPRWQLKEVGEEQELWYSLDYPTLRKLLQTDDPKAGRDAFLLEIYCEALIQWALGPIWSSNGNDRENYDEVFGAEPPDGVEPEKWERLVEVMIPDLEAAGRKNAQNPYQKAALLHRQCAGELMRLFEQRDN